MKILIYLGVALWIGIGIVIFVWIFVLWAQMMNNRVPKQWPIFERRQFTFQTDPADYTEVGKQYRQKAIRAEIVFLAYILFLAIVIASRV